VQRQYTGTAGRIDNAQIAVYLVYATEAAHAFIDRGLYLPACWTDDPKRCKAAGVPASTVFATKPVIARAMIARALDAGVPAGWVAGDEVYGADPGLRTDVEAREVGYVAGRGLRPPRADRSPSRRCAGRPAIRRAWQRAAPPFELRGDVFVRSGDQCRAVPDPACRSTAQGFDHACPLVSGGGPRR
jgi:SRSO17 transposase